MSKKCIVFITATRADFGKLKSLISILQNSECFDVHIFATGMHLNSKYGLTVNEIFKSGFKNIFRYINHDRIVSMDRTLAKTIDGFSHYVAEIKPDMIVVHGDRVETLAGAIVGSLNNILVAHIEGGEISGTIDELIRHSVSKMVHIHLTTNEDAKKRLIQLGERVDSIYILGSPDLDLMNPENLPTLNVVKKYYDINFDEYAVAMFHPVTTEYNKIKENAKNFINALIESDLNYILIYPNNDLGSQEILSEYSAFKNNGRIQLFPSLRFEFFLRLLQSSRFMIGNSSSGVREAPYYNLPTVDIGTRQRGRVNLKSVIHCGYEKKSILEAIHSALIYQTSGDYVEDHDFGFGDSDKIILELFSSKSIWEIECQKIFCDIGE